MLNLIAKAQAATTNIEDTVNGVPLAEPPSQTETFLINLVLVLVLVVLFYFLLIKPQQKRIQKHQAMLGGLKKGAKVVTAGGLVATIHKISEDNDEVVLDLGKDLRVTALKSTIHNQR